ncbi:MAG: hypothetical protein ABI605_06730 [Rhizobacter sp.]
MTTSALTRQRQALGLVAVATLVASVWALNDDGDALAAPGKTGGAPKTAVERPAGGNSGPGAHADALTLLSLPERTAPAGMRRNLFAATVSAAPVMAAASAAAPPPPPPAITLPFTFGGRLVTATGASVLLNTGAMTQVLAVGATLGDFRFEQDDGSQLAFIHVPSGERLVLAIQP